jgi:predicted peptidase
MAKPLKVPKQTEQRLSVRVTYAYDYLLQLPPGYTRTGKKRWPLLMFFHGRGERGHDLKLVRLHGPPKLIAEGRTFPFIVVSPQCPDDEWWNYPALEVFVSEMVRRYRVDPDRVCLTGLSMGGFATWALAQHRPERYAAIAPVCGGGETRVAANLRDLPIWAFHGGLDEVIVPRRSREMVAAIKAAGGAPRLTIYPRAGHDSWTQAYANEELYTWMLAQRRRKKSL